MALLAGGLLLLAAIADIWHWRQRWRLFRQHPQEPWRWETSWKQELRPWVGWSEHLGLILATLFVVFVAVGVLGSLYQFGGFTLMLPALLSLLAVVAYAVWRGTYPSVQRLIRELRPGQPSLRLASIPLALGTQSQVHVVSRPGLPPVDMVTVRLTRTRERVETVRSGNKSKTTVYRTLEYEHSHQVDAKALREGRALSLLLELPNTGVENATVWHGAYRCFWDLELFFDGSSLSSLYRLPVYFAGGGLPQVLPGRARRGGRRGV
ncbi:hypothetical protein POL68_32010 [Stigmatella sp. ncwal1]|uniref:DUF58 domain-containing protein n=1 Tax=Stigmatella ashevillensis TaxID=2995309 RepID=A0ABT5DL96_9BACT|nr:hypothetical protein [Stigmatella ashevillena]MDC0713131.1 hypothetical protein [Stigmatella ashevillena]